MVQAIRGCLFCLYTNISARVERDVCQSFGVRSLDEWSGALASVERRVPTETLAAPIRRSLSGAAAFLGLMESGQKCWVKVPGNPQGDQVLVNEQIVAHVGKLIGAPVAGTALVEIPDDLAGWRYREGYLLEKCIAHGSFHIEAGEESEDLIYTGRDHNAQRQAVLLALWDWCMGTDPQWIYSHSDESSLFSFDHGMWFGGESGWTIGDLKKMVHSSWSMGRDLKIPKGLDRAAFLDVAHRLEAVTATDLVDAVAAVPAAWAVPDSDLEAVAWFLDARKSEVASRMRQLSTRS